MILSQWMAARGGVASSRSRFVTPAFAAVLYCLATAAVAEAPVDQPVKLNPDIPMTYTVQPGDTLWGVAAIYLRDPWRWRESWSENPDIHNPHLIYPGDELKFVWTDGMPRLRRSAPREVKLSPSAPVGLAGSAIPPVPQHSIASFRREYRMVDVDNLLSAAYIVSGGAGRLISGPGDAVYSTGALTGEGPYQLVRPFQSLKDPLSGEDLGTFAEVLGEAIVLDTNTRLMVGTADSKLIRLLITESREEIRVGDRLLPVHESGVPARFQLGQPDFPVDDAHIIAARSGKTNIGISDVVVVNRGHRDSLKAGDLLAVNQTGQTVIDPLSQTAVRMPDSEAGVLVIFDVYERASFGLVLEASRPLAVGDKVSSS